MDDFTVFKHKWRTSVLFCVYYLLWIHNVSAQDPFEVQCQEGWTLEGGKCYKLVTEAMEYVDALSMCESFGGQMANPYGYSSNTGIETQIVGDTVEYWIGFTTLMSDPDNPTIGMWSDGTPASINMGFWGPSQPVLDATSACASVLRDEANFYTPGWKLTSCNRVLPFVCVRPSCTPDSFFCANGGCIQTTEHICDEKNQCGDFSDEIECPANNHFKIEGPSGTVASGAYDADADWQWTIEAEPGTRISLQFTSFNTEAGMDTVQVWVGGMTQEDSTLEATLSGDLVVTDLPAYISPNHLMILKLVSDSSVQAAGFSAEYTTESILPVGETLIAPVDNPETISSPGYPNGFSSMIRQTWVIEAERIAVISLQVLALDIGRSGVIEIHDGPTIESPLLATFPTQENVQLIISTQQYMTVYFNSLSDFKGAGFEFSYVQGCKGNIVADHGVITSPGQAVQPYANSQVCEISITPESDNFMRIIVDMLDTQEDGDILRIYHGDSADGTLALEVSGTPPADSMIGFVDSAAAGDGFFVTFESNSIIDGLGFIATFGTDCPDPEFNANTIVDPPNVAAFSLGLSLTVTCEPSFFFAQEEHMDSTEVTITCNPGGWNVFRYPQCERVYCGVPPAVENGYVASSTGVQFGDTVTYGCLGGSGILGSASIECDGDGNWPTPPVCTSNQCSPLSDIQNGLRTVVRDGVLGSANSYGSIESFSCLPGHELVGSPVLMCEANGQWTSTTPSCELISCCLPEVAHAVFTPSADVLFGDSVTVSCEAGYLLNGTDTMLCGDDGEFDEVPKCDDIDECADQSTGCEFPDHCENTVGSFVCNCPPGYRTNQVDDTQCDDIPECTEDNPCDPVQGFCTEGDGTYTCDCLTGFELFTEDGTAGFTIPTEEDGLLRGDMYHINHTCVPVMCEDLTLDNGDILSTLEHFHFGDIVYVQCHLGYQRVGPDSLLCQDDGTWDQTIPTCEIATCEDPSAVVATLPYPPSSTEVVGASPGDPITFGTTVTFNCTDHLPSAVVIERECVYDQDTDTYRVITDGICPVVDCGTPSAISGADYIPEDITDTLLNAQFEVTCKTLYELDGESGAQDTTVRCMDSGKWDFGDLSCLGSTCTDPGTPPGATQIAENYAEGKQVTFECIRDGFELDDPTPLTCTSDGTSIFWDRTNLPNCVDVEAPTWTDCPAEDELVDKLASANIIIPTPSDNSGLVADFTVDPPGFHPSIVITEDMNITYTATDHAGLHSTCNFNIRVRDDVSPIITCPDSYVFNIVDETSNIVDYTLNPATATDNVGTPTITYEPATLDVDGSYVDQFQVVTATAIDEDGNSDTCRFTIIFRAEPCQGWSLETPAGGSKDCTETPGGGFSCEVSCPEGQYFYDEPEANPLVRTCGPGEEWIRVPDCVEPTEPAAFVTGMSIEYQTVDPGATFDASCIEDYYMGVFELSVAESFELTKPQCETSTSNLLPPGVVLTPLLSLNHPTTANQILNTITFTVYMEMEPRDQEYNTASTICSSLWEVFVENLAQQAEPLRILDASPTLNCPALETPEDDPSKRVLQSREYECAFGERQQISDRVCLPCPRGTYLDDTTGECVLCDETSYQDQTGQGSCEPCPANRPFAWRGGARSLEECVYACNTPETNTQGMVSVLDQDIPHCENCPKNTYATDANTCTECGLGRETHYSGSASEDDCKEACHPGHYSATGFEPCEPCPHHFYQDDFGQTTCIECDDDQTLNAEGSTTQACESGATTVCGPGSCSGDNSLSCTTIFHRAFCECKPGYTGEYCGDVIDHCESDPCYFGSQCTSDPETGYTCTCPTDEYSGDRCENDPENCPMAGADACEDGQGQCQDLPDEAVCLCMEGFTGPTCAEIEDACVGDPCGDQGQCQAFGHVRYVCTCNDGFTGDNCEINIDECESNPCLYGAECQDGEADYTCDCPDALHSGKNCEIRPDYCAGNPCGNTGTCIDDYKTNSFRCVCSGAYLKDFSQGNGTWFETIDDVSESQCLLVDLCAENPCQNEAPCSQDESELECGCPAGYSGSLCQHDTDDCAGNPCVNGDCIDDVDGFRCECHNGYQGDTCVSDINDCDPYRCEETGTDQSQGTNGCTDLVGGHQCHCNPGFSGINCEINENDCECEPCLHGGVCSDLDNDFECECPDGWDGKRCENIKDNCDPDNCENDAPCFNLFGDYLCICDEQSYGKNCDLQASICEFANPCIDPDSTCTELEDGPECSCSFDYTGEGCHVTVDYCLERDDPDVEPVCLNGGLCERRPDGFECSCVGDFSGDRCEISEDNCANVVCNGGGNCVDGMGTYFCECPVASGMTGPNCDKPVDNDFDIFIFSSTLSGVATLNYPFVFGVNSFSVAMFVRFSQDGGSGTFFTLYGMDHQYPSAPKTELLKITEAGVVLSFAGYEIESTYDVYDIKNRQWYHLLISWDGDTGDTLIYVNSVRVNNFTDYGAGTTLPDFGWIVLGSEYDVVQDAPIIGEGFNGYLSQVQVWNRPLDFLTEIPHIAADRTYKIEDGLFVGWYGYTLGAGAEFVKPSTANAPVCLPGSTSQDCVDVTSAPLLICPNDVILYGLERLTSVSWDDPIVAGSPTNPVSLYPKGRSFVWGKYTNFYGLTGEDGNTATCSFDIYVRYNECQDPEPPTVAGNGGTATVQCYDDQAPFVICEIECPENYGLSVPAPNFYTCGPLGSFNVHNIYLNFKFPQCAPMVKAKVKVNMQIVYRAVLNCPGVLASGAVQQDLMDVFTALDALWGATQGSTGGFCLGNPCADTITITPQCSGTGARRRRQANAEDIEVDITTGELLASLFDSSGQELTPEEILRQAILDNGLFDLPNIPSGGTPDFASLLIDLLGVCEDGQALIDDSCVDCSAGTYYADESCVPCALGSYQPDTKQTECIPCTDGLTTELEGSEQASDCKEVCVAGYMFDGTGCVACPRGFYQDETGQFYCKPCDSDKTTQDEASTTVDACYNICPSGEELSSADCVPCQRGFYRTAGVEDSCTACTDSAFVTPAEGSFSDAECTVPNCSPGNRIDGDTCTECPVESYQPDSWQEDCEPCPASYKALNPGAVSSDQCLFFCPLGEEETSTNTCTECQVGYYKDNDIPLQNCVPCDNGLATLDTGSTGPDQCTHLGCGVGEEPNSDDTECLPCPLGFYQPEENKEACLECAAGLSTREEGATAEEQCEEYCPSGQAFNALGECEDCERGYFKDNDVYKFAECTLCPEEFITEGPGTATEAECTVANCGPGEKLDTVANVCNPCDIGEYQPDKWQTECLQCEDQRTTLEEGSTSESDCRLNCDAGFEDKGNDACGECDVGYFKPDVGIEPCEQCPENDRGRVTITPDIGTINSDECTIEQCVLGEYNENAGNFYCFPCLRGQYQDERQRTECKECGNAPDGNPLTTLGEGKTSEDECVLNCESGQGYNLDSASCELCAIGTYRTQGAQDICELCPPEFITAAEGAFALAQCDIANCTEGSYRDSAENECVLCDRGSYQDEKWQDDSCKPCPSETSDTIGEGTVAEDECYRECGVGLELQIDLDTCVECERGFYRGADDFFCQECPDDKTTAGKASTLVTDCALPNCAEGQKTVGEECVDCPIGEYQPDKWQAMCITCPAGQLTAAEGSTDSSDCIDPCDGDRCPNDGEVCVVDITLPDGYECQCFPGWIGSPPNCEHLCDSGEYCLHDGDCIRSGENGQEATCDCTDRYEGERCQTRKEPQSMTPYIIGGAVGGFLFLLLILLLCALCCWCCKPPATKPHPNFVNPAYEPLPGMVQHPQKYTGSLAGSLGRNMSSMTAFAPMVIPRTDDGRSMAGYSGMPGDRRYLYYEDTDDFPVNRTQSIHPATVASGYDNRSYDPYEEKVGSIIFS